jgi:ribonuclease PH
VWTVVVWLFLFLFLFSSFFFLLIEIRQGCSVRMELTREDGRKSDEMRQLVIEQGLLVKADGSARFCLGKTRSVAAVYGPAESVKKSEMVEKAVIDVIYKGKDSQLEETLKKCIEAVCLTTLHPRTAIRVVVQPLSEDGSTFSAIANRFRTLSHLFLHFLFSRSFLFFVYSAMVGLLDAGVQLSSVFVAASCAVTKEGLLLIDPSKQEEEDAAAVLDVVLDGTLEGVLVSRCRGEFATPEEYFKCIKLAAKMCETLLRFIRKTTENRFEQE